MLFCKCYYQLDYEALYIHKMMNVCQESQEFVINMLPNLEPTPATDQFGPWFLHMGLYTGLQNFLTFVLNLLGMAFTGIWNYTCISMVFFFSCRKVQMQSFHDLRKITKWYIVIVACLLSLFYGTWYFLYDCLTAWSFFILFINFQGNEKQMLRNDVH